MNTDPRQVIQIPVPTRSRLDPVLVATDIALLRHFPERFGRLLGAVPSEDLSATYRAGGWTVAEIVHHLVDSHIHAYSRTKFALLEDRPSIKPYDENRWVGTPECSSEDVPLALTLLGALHVRWARLFATLSEESWSRTFHHPEQDRDIPLFEQVAVCAWHGEHHLAQAALALRADLPL